MTVQVHLKLAACQTLELYRFASSKNIDGQCRQSMHLAGSSQVLSTDVTIAIHRLADEDGNHAPAHVSCNHLISCYALRKTINHCAKRCKAYETRTLGNGT